MSVAKFLVLICTSRTRNSVPLLLPLQLVQLLMNGTTVLFLLLCRQITLLAISSSQQVFKVLQNSLLIYPFTLVIQLYHYITKQNIYIFLGPNGVITEGTFAAHCVLGSIVHCPGGTKTDYEYFVVQMVWKILFNIKLFTFHIDYWLYICTNLFYFGTFCWFTGKYSISVWWTCHWCRL